jgi:hypothetical protein
MEANSGAAFARSLSSKLNAGKANRQNALAWNLGIGYEQSSTQLCITSIISLSEMLRLSHIYFSTLHQCYGFLNVDGFNQKVLDRWEKFDSGDPYDPVLCGVAALGSLFSGGHPSPREAELVQSAKTALETTSILSYPTQEQAAAWVLRTLYFRCTSRPHAAWIASCITMHTIEAISTTVGSETPLRNQTPAPGAPQDTDTNNRVFWVAGLLNTWIANEYGRSKVKIKGISYDIPSPRAGDFTTDLLYLYQISERLDPDQIFKAKDFEDGIAEIAAFRSPRDGITLSQSNLCFALYRRLRLVNSQISRETSSQILSLGVTGLEAVMRLAEARLPWWHVANVPFQFICVLLVMDTSDALSHIDIAMRTLETVAQRFPTPSIDEALRTARLLVRLSQKRKQEDVLLLNKGLRTQPAGEASAMPAELQSTQQYMQPVTPGSLDLDLNMTDLTDCDWDVFLATDVPIFDGAIGR